LINSSQQFSGSTTVTNRWGIYQAGSNDTNYFAGQSLFNRRVDFNDLIVVSNIVYSAGNTTNFIAGNTNDLVFYNNSINTVLATLFTTSTGNLRIGTGSDSTRKLQVVGQQEWITTVGTGVHTTSGNHLPIWVNGVQYWLALLNPPV